MTRAGAAASFSCGVNVVFAAFMLTSAAAFAGQPLVVTDATVPMVTQIGGDIPLTMTVANPGAEDALLRARCPFVNFTELHTVDYGEGAPAMRAVRAIPLPAGATTALTTKSFHVMLLQTRETLASGQSHVCTVTFRNAGTTEITVRVTAPAP